MKITIRLLLSLFLILSLVTPLLADTIRLKDGSVIRGKVVGFCNPGCRDEFAAAPERFPEADAQFDLGPEAG